MPVTTGLMPPQGISPRGFLHAIVLAGGAGRRLLAFTKALTGTAQPKQFCRFGSQRTLLEQTLMRLQPVVPAERMVVIVDKSHMPLAGPSLRCASRAALVAQPADRGTAAGVLLPLLEVLRNDPHAVVVVTPSDHGLRDDQAFRESVGLAHLAVLHDPSRLVLFGVEPSFPSTDYGWISPGAPIREPLDLGLREVVGFVEKPSRSEASFLITAGAVWSTMVLVARAATLFETFRRLEPVLTSHFERHAGAARSANLEAMYEALPVRDFSRDLLSRADRLALATWPVTLGWSDLGTPERMLDWLRLAEAEEPVVSVPSNDTLELAYR
ncbi:MAG: sugar phosphate nucleotidyltransferase [Planctomycetota bacterium]